MKLNHRATNSFNPCFDGSEARVLVEAVELIFVRGFNPCFDGSEARAPRSFQGRGSGCVSILVLMEVKREWSRTNQQTKNRPEVSILVLMEVKREERVEARARSPGLVSILVLMEVKRESTPAPIRSAAG